MPENPRLVFGFASLALLIVLAVVRCTPHVAAGFALASALRSLYGVAFADREGSAAVCEDWCVAPGGPLTDGQRLVAGSLLNALGCADQAVQVLPAFAAGAARSNLLAYQWGLVAWNHGDAPAAAALWRQGQDIDRLLLAQARRKAADLDAAQRWYEAAIMAAGSPQMQAETITAYTEDLRGRMSPEQFKTRLAYLAAYFGPDTAIGYRLNGQRAFGEGSYGAAARNLSQAITLGFADNETWYLLGEAAWKTGDLATTEKAFRSALAASIQVTGRRPWHLDRLAALLISEKRLDEALPFQEQAVRLSDYYYYADNLAVLYAQLGQVVRAQAMCAQAAVSRSVPKALRCRNP
ncbi:MAG: tetratricopeptide repeat protein [Chloroflexi bacterium]|nr:tetratricopeptide repeat protein [Chloroflexota bacterium]